MTDTDKLNLILKTIAASGGPERGGYASDEEYFLAISNWLLRPTQTPRPKFMGYEMKSAKPSCGCGGRK